MECSYPVSPRTLANCLPSYLLGPLQPCSPNQNISPSRDEPNTIFSSTPIDPINLRQKLFEQSLNETHLPQPAYDNLQIKRNWPPTQSLFDYIEDRCVEPICNCATQSVRGNQSSSFNESYSWVAREALCYDQAVSALINSSDKTPCATNLQYSGCKKDETLWVTVFGFPPSCTSLVLAQLMNCGCIVEKKFPAKGNWIHIKYGSLKEVSKALSLNGKLISGNIMIGIVPYYNKQGNKKYMGSSEITSPLRSLKRAIVIPHNSNTVIPQNVPQKATGLVTKVMEYVFGW